jgi:hypothetical protein
MNTMRVLLVLLSAVALGGCAAFRGHPERATDPQADLQALAPHLDAAAASACLQAPSVACRNRVIGARMYAADIQFSQFEQSLFNDTRSGGFAATLSTLGLTTVAAASSGGVTQVLSGLSAFIIGGREAFQKEVLAERTAIAIHTAMRGRRAQVALRLREGLARPIELYPVESALGDIHEYYTAGTVLGALVDITETVGQSTRQAEADLRKVAFQGDAEVDKLERAVCGQVGNRCASPDPEALKRLLACMEQAGVPKADVTPLLFEPKFAPQKALVTRCMKL